MPSLTYPRFQYLRSAFAVVVLASIATVGVRADTVPYNSQSSWSTALGGPSVTVLNFMGPDETTGASVNNATLASYYHNLGVDFQPFAGSSVYPVIYRNQQYQISSPNHDGLLTNNPAPNRNEVNGTIIFTFNTTVRGVGAFSNNIDHGHIDAYDIHGNLLGSANIGFDGLGQFGGVVSDVAIAEVHLVNTYNSDYAWGLYDLQFGPGVAPQQSSNVPEAGQTSLMLAAALGALAFFRRRA